MKYLLISLLLIISGTAKAQVKPFYNTEFGFDIIWAIVATSGHTLDQVDLEFMYRENVDPFDLRFKFTYSTAFENEGDLIFSKRLTDSTSLFNYFVSKRRGQVDVGYAKNQKFSFGSFYYGIDLFFAQTWGRINGYREPCEEGLNVICNDFGRLRDRFSKVGIAPIAGIKLPISERLFFGIEFNFQLGVAFGERSVFDTYTTSSSYSFTQFEIDMDQLISDLAVFYKF